MKKFLIGFVIFLLLSVGGAAFYLMNTDWVSQNKDKIAEQFYNSTGKIIHFDGEVSFRFFPVPYLHANNVKIFHNENPAAKPFAEIHTLNAELAFKPLLKKELEVTNMEIKGGKFYIDLDNGINWQNDLSPDQRQLIEESKLSLSNTLIKDSEVVFESVENNTSFRFTNLNGEISAESILGPFRLEGNCINDTTLEAFAITIGRLSNASATPLNIGIKHELSQTTLRFDGSFQTTNKVINGNVIIESKNLSKFINSNFPSHKIPKEYDQKFDIGFDMAINSQNIDLSNIVVIYGDKTSGSGSLQMPRGDEQPLIETSFNFIDIDLDIFKNLFSDILSQSQNLKNLPDYSVTGEIKALRLHYDNQQMRDLETSFTYTDHALTLKNTKVLLPGNTDIHLSGSLFPVEDVLNYKGSVDIKTDNLTQTLKWLQMEPKQTASSVYKNMVLDAQISGNLERLQISPFKITLDKSTATGEIGIIFGDKKDIMVIAQIDTVNFDNYISALPDEVKQQSWLERILYRFKKTDFLNNIDLVLDTKADLIIYENMPFEQIKLKGNVLNSIAEIENFSINKIANSEITINGKLSGFGDTPKFENFNYNITGNDISSLINKLELKVPDLEYKKFNNLSTRGNINGPLNDIDITTSVNIGNLQTEFSGKIANIEKNPDFDGRFNIKHPSFNQFLENIQSSYIPSIDNLGMFQFKANMHGTTDNYTIENMDMNIGTTNITGTIARDTIDGKPNYIAKIDSNRFDVSKFLPKNKNGAMIVEKAADNQAAFMALPYYSDDPINYDLYQKANLKASVKSAELIWLESLLKESSFDLEIFNNNISIKNFSGTYKETPISSEITINMGDEPSVAFSGSIENSDVNNFALTGKTYGLLGGTFSAQWNLTSSAESLTSFWQHLNGTAEITAVNTTVNGINSSVIYEDLLQRKNNTGLSETVRDALKSGNSPFSEVTGRLNFSDGNFSISDASMSAPNLKIKIYGEGNMKDWSMNSVFNAKFDQPQTLPEFSFILKDSIANPVLDINVDSLFQFYKSKVDRQFAEAEQISRNTKNQRIAAFEEQKKIADNIVVEARDILEKDIDAKSQTAYSEKTKARYTALQQDLANTLAGLIEKITSFDITKLQDEDIIEADKINKASKQNIQDLSDKLHAIYLDDLKTQAENYNNQITEEYNQLKQLSFYNSSLTEKYKERLSSITTDYSLENDREFEETQDEILTKLAFLEKMNQDAAELYQKSPKNTAENYEKINSGLADILDKIRTEREELKNNIDIFDAAETQKIDNEEEIYLAQQEKEKNNLLIKENSGSVRIKKSGKVLKVSRDLDEIKNIREEVSQDKVRVLDFTKDKINIPATSSPKVGIVKKGGNLIAN